jgi:hypothetical protein
MLDVAQSLMTWICHLDMYAVLAQLVERKALNLVVQGSSPWGGDEFLFRKLPIVKIILYLHNFN